MSDGKCTDCGRYMSLAGGASSARMFDFVAMEPRYDHFRCVRCTEHLGAVCSNARPHDGNMSPYQSVHE